MMFPPVGIQTRQAIEKGPNENPEDPEDPRIVEMHIARVKMFCDRDWGGVRPSDWSGGIRGVRNHIETPSVRNRIKQEAAKEGLKHFTLRLY
jgi:hypothetical protein